uniref:Immunoglobulin domain-containing protein n=1 Tax=Cyprinus carpio TaxID=7962 RepID=A0A8C1LQS0_CYPCA
MFCLYVFCCLCFWHLVVFGVEYEVKPVSVTEGESVTLQTHVTEIQTDDLITWTFGHSTTLIAQINKVEGIVSTYDDVLDGRFRNRLKLDHQTGSLNITDTRTTDSGNYTVNIKGTNLITYRFNLTVYGKSQLQLCLFCLCYLLEKLILIWASYQWLNFHDLELISKTFDGPLSLPQLTRMHSNT